MAEHFDVDECASLQMATQLAIAWWEQRPATATKRKAIAGLGALNKKMDRFINLHCTHEYEPDGPDCGCGSRAVIEFPAKK